MNVLYTTKATVSGGLPVMFASDIGMSYFDEAARTGRMPAMGSIEGGRPCAHAMLIVGYVFKFLFGTSAPRLLAGILLKRVVLALSVGAIVRETNELYDPYRVPDLLRFQVGHELTWGGGLTVKAHQVIGFGIEAVGTVPLVGEGATATALVLGSIYLQPTPKLKLILSGGGGVLKDNPRNADGRAILGFAYSLSPRASHHWSTDAAQLVSVAGVLRKKCTLLGAFT